MSVAKIEFIWGDYRDKLMNLELSVEAIIKRSVYPAAGLLIETIKANTPVAHADDWNNLKESMALRAFDNDDGFVYTAVAFEGYDARGVPNAVKARVLESGSSTRQKHPFVRPAVNQVKKQLMAMIETNINSAIEEKMK